MRSRYFLGHIRNERGVAAIEAALVLPVFILFLIGAVELYQFFRAQSIVDRAAYEIAQSLSLQERITSQGPCTVATNLCVYERVAKQLFHPLDFDKYGRLEIAVYTSRQESDDAPVLWDRQPGWPASFGNASVRPSPAAFFPLQAVRPEETVLSVELAYDTSHLILTGRMREALTGSSTIVGRAFLRTRNDAFRSLEPGQP